MAVLTEIKDGWALFDDGTTLGLPGWCWPRPTTSTDGRPGYALVVRPIDEDGNEGKRHGVFVATGADKAEFEARFEYLARRHGLRVAGPV